MKFEESISEDKGNSYEGIFVPLDVELMQSFYDEIATLHIKDLEQKDINPLHLTGKDREMWENLKSRKPIDEEAFKEYYARVEEDRVDASFGYPRYCFAGYLLKHFTNLSGGRDGSLNTPTKKDLPLKW